MKIRFARIDPEHLAPVRAEVDLLSRAVNAGDMAGVDGATEKLLALTSACPSVDLSEQAWRAFMDGLRATDPGFQSNHLLPGEVCASILPTASASDLVLELPIDDPSDEEAFDV